MSFIQSILAGSVLQKHFTSAVILAAGMGTRFGSSDVKKQNVPVAGIPALVRAALPFEKSEKIDEIVIVAAKDEIATVEGYVSKYSLTKVVRIAEGGETRADSSMAGVAAVSDKCRYVAIHDAARCLVTEKMIEDAVTASFRYGAAACAERVVDTVKIADDNGFIKETADRNHVWLVKTPQVFKLSVYETAAAITKQDGIAVTDDCMMAEHAGLRVKLVDCGHENIKLTVREDLDLAEFILSKREKTED